MKAHCLYLELYHSDTADMRSLSLGRLGEILALFKHTIDYAVSIDFRQANI